MYLYNGSIYSTQADLAVAFASECSATVNTGVVRCVVAGDGISVTANHYDFAGLLLNTSTFLPPLVVAPDLITDYISISMGIILVWVVAWGIRAVLRML